MYYTCTILYYMLLLFIWRCVILHYFVLHCIELLYNIYIYVPDLLASSISSRPSSSPLTPYQMLTWEAQCQAESCYIQHQT